MSATIHQLAPVRKGRKRVSQSMDAAGCLSLILLRQRDQEPPANVVRFTPLPEPTPMKLTPELLLCTALFCELPPERQAAIKEMLRLHGEERRDPDFLAAFHYLNRD